MGFQKGNAIKTLVIGALSFGLLCACGGADTGNRLDSYNPPAGTTHIARGVLKSAPNEIIILGYHTGLIECIEGAEVWAGKTMNKHKMAGCQSVSSYQSENEIAP